MKYFVRKKMRIGLLLVSMMLMIEIGTCQVYDMREYGIIPNSREDVSKKMSEALRAIKQDSLTTNGEIILYIEKGRYDFYPEEAEVYTLYISNHDQINPKRVGIMLEDMENVVIDGQGSEFIFHGRMLPIAMIRSKNCILKNFSIDFEQPHIGQATIIANDTNKQEGITIELAPWVKYEIRDSVLYLKGEGWEHVPHEGIAFDAVSKHILYRTSDVVIASQGVVEKSPRVIYSPKWRNNRLTVGSILALRGYGRPAPGIFLDQNHGIKLENLTIHYAEGMGLIAQGCEDLQLDRFSVRLRENSGRYFTTQADATHFSGCKGVIVSEKGIYEGMMDDAINVHGTYLKVIRRLSDTTLLVRYMHPQSYGFRWGNEGDTVQFIHSSTMEVVGEKNIIAAISAVDQPSISGAKEFKITLAQRMDTVIDEGAALGIENLTWTPEVHFSGNIIRNNRARGALFSTPKRVIVENNLFDHTSGAAILLCGDCNGWYETGSCNHVTIRNNHFINALTNLFQFTEAVISIYPVIPDLASQRICFHRNITIEDNVFETFDYPIIYAKSVDGLIIRRNIIHQNHDYPAFHQNKERYKLEKVWNVEIKE